MSSNVKMKHPDPCVEESETQRIAFRRRRRRKRPRSSSATISNAGLECDKASRKAQDASCGLPLENQAHSGRLSYPLLLDLRATGRRRMQADTSNKHRNMRRSIRFSQLQSPPSEAVLALERSGSYFLSLCGKTDTTDGSPLLSLRIYGVPSPARLQERESRSLTHRPPVCPLVQTIPLVYDASNVADESVSPVATTPVQIVISSDWTVGMGFLHHSTCSSTPWSASLARFRLTQHPATHEDDSLGTLILFCLTTRGPSKDIVQSYKCSNVRLAARCAFTMRNLLWETNMIPHQTDESGSLCRNVLNLPGYLFLNDEDDGFRMTWVMLSEWTECKEEYVIPLPPSQLVIVPSRHDIILQSDEVVWDEVRSERYSGTQNTSYSDADQSLDIAFEAYFRVDALLDDILSRRRKTFDYNDAPDFHYNLISLKDGRTITMILVFGRHLKSPSGKESRSSVGVFLQIDIFTQTYEETGWVQHSALPEASFLRKWSNVLALNRRMKDQRIGPFCTENTDNVVDRIDWSFLYDDTADHDDCSLDADPDVWGPHVARIKKSVKQNEYLQTHHDLKSMRISSASLFPNCELITNDAVRSAKPVASIQCRSSLVEFVYG